MMHIYNDLLKEAKFDRVIWVTVSQAFNVAKLQNDIASKLNERLDDDEDEIMRAGKLTKMLERSQGRNVLILDDVWESLALEQVGIPQPTPQNGFKLVLTSRSERVARSMGFQIVRVKPLSSEEALELFCSKVGDGAIMKTPTLAPTVKLVVEECAGLPLAIVVVGSSMRGIDDPFLWQNALNELRQQVKRSLQEVEDKVFGRLKFSYNRLKHEKDQLCFLYCALYPEDHEINRDELIEYWVEEGLIDEMESREAMKCSGHAILHRLEENCLLIKVSESYNKMHDVVRDMALHIMTRKRYFVKAGLQLKELPEWNIEDVEKVSLMRNSISEIPLLPNMQSPSCQHLTTLLLSNNGLRKIPEAFFDYMPNLKILDLSGNPIQVLPNSLSNLENLTALLLRGCCDLEAMPCLSKLQALKKLDLRRSRMDEVPRGLEMLINLRYLNLGFCYKIPKGTISKLYRLQHLAMDKYTSVQGAEEIKELNKLEVFVGGLSKVSEWNKFVSFGKRLIKYHIFITGKGPVGYGVLQLIDSDFQDGKVVEFVGIRIKDGDVIRLPSDVEVLIINGCEGAISLKQGMFPPTTSFSSLKEIYVLDISYCGEMKKLFLGDWVLRDLHNLEVIQVCGGGEMEEIISLSKEEEGNLLGTNRNSPIKFSLPKLRSLTFIGLGELKSICSRNGVLVCDSLQYINILKCPKLKRIPLYLPLLHNGNPSPPPPLKEIQVSNQEWWESLEWDHPNAKNVLQRFLTFPN